MPRSRLPPTIPCSQQSQDWSELISRPKIPSRLASFGHPDHLGEAQRRVLWYDIVFVSPRLHVIVMYHIGTCSGKSISGRIDSTTCRSKRAFIITS